MDLKLWQPWGRPRFRSPLISFAERKRRTREYYSALKFHSRGKWIGNARQYHLDDFNDEFLAKIIAKGGNVVFRSGKK